MQMIIKNAKNIFKKKIEGEKNINIIHNRRGAIRNKAQTQ